MADAELLAKLKLDASQYNKDMGKAVEIAKSAAASIDKTSQSVDKLEKEYLELAKATGYTVDGLGRVHDATGKFAKTSDEVANKLRQLRQQMQEAGGSTDAFVNPLRSNVPEITGYIKSLTSAVAGYITVAKTVAASDEWTTLNNRIRLVTATQSEFETAQKSIVAISQNTGQALGSIGSTYQSLARSHKELGLSQQQVLQLTDTISKAMVIGGGTAEGNAAALVQLGQAFSSGVLRGEEFNSVMEQAPGLAKALADGLNVPVGALRSMANDGKLTADMVAQALLKMKDSVDSQFGLVDKTISQSMESLKTSFTQFVGQTSDATGAASKISSAIQLLGNNLNVAANAVMLFMGIKLTSWLVSATASGTKLAATYVLQAQAAGTAAAATNGNAIAIAGASMSAARGIPAVTSFTAALGILRTGAVTATAAMRTLLISMGPVGWVALAGSAVAAMAAIKSGTESQTQSLITQTNNVKELRQEYEKLNEAKKLQYQHEVEIDLAASTKSIQELRNELKIMLGQTKEIEEKGLIDLNKAVFGVKDIDSTPLKIYQDEWKAVESGSKTALMAYHELQEAGKISEPDAKVLKDWAAEYDKVATKYYEDIRRQETILGKPITKSVYLDVIDDSKTPSAAAIQVQADVTGITEQFKSMSTNLGLSSEQIKINTAVQQINTQLAKDGNSAATISALEKAKADAQGAQAALDKYNQDKAAYDEGKKKLELEQQNAKAVEDMIAAKEKEVAAYEQTSTQMAAYDAAVKGATKEQQDHLSELQAVTEAYKRQKDVMTSLETIIDGYKTAGMSAIDKQLYQLEKKGATKEELKMAKDFLQATEVINDASKEQQRLTAESKKAANDVKTTQQKAADTMLDAANTMGKTASKDDIKEAKNTPQMQYFTGASNKSDPLKTPIKAGDGKQNLGEFTLNLATERGLIGSFPMLGYVKNIDDLRNAFNMFLNQYRDSGAAANT